MAAMEESSSTLGSGAMSAQSHQPMGYRSSLALHISQQEIPFSSSSSQPQSFIQVPQSSGYGPPIPTTPTPLQKLIAQHLAEGTEFDMLAAPISNSSWKERWESMCVVGAAKMDSPELEAAKMREAEAWRLSGAFSRGEVNVTRSDECQALIGLTPDWLELDSPVEGIRFDSELALKQELAYAAHLHIQTLILPPPRNRDFVSDYARTLANILAGNTYLSLSIRIPVSSSSDSADTNEMGPWEMWNSIRHLCAYSHRLSITLDLSTPLASAPSLMRWQAEPVRAIFLPASTFIPNAKGYPVLTKAMQGFLQTLFRFKPTLILSGILKGLHSAGGPEAYPQYVRFLERKTPIEDPIEQYAGSYLDYLQAPLQPLMDNLEGDTYEGFEKDPVKYHQYEEATYLALCDRPANKTTVIFVVGAGRGPLVEGCLRAAQRANRKVELTAVEKNPNAFVVLQGRKALEWGNAVELVFSDMRSFMPSKKADIIVSELLGSFGDNELSPECLDGVMRVLAPDGISIPASYTAYLAPVSSSKLHSDVTNHADTKPAEQPYVVMFHASNILSEAGGRLGCDRVAECWGFDHPRLDIATDPLGLPLTNHHNARSAHVTFHIPHGGVCHGFGGYFEAVLYGNVGLSIHPERMDRNMLSWFPLFFPLREPLYLPPRSELDVHIFRLTDGAKRRVWFEWSAESFLPLPSTTLPSNPSGVFPKTPLDNRSWGTPLNDAFGNAPSPMPQSGSTMQNGFTFDQANEVMRVKIGETRLHNPAGKCSWVGL